MTGQPYLNQARERVATRCVCCDGGTLASSPAILMPFVAHRALGYPPVRIDESWGLRTVQQGMAYSICKSLLCRDCGHLFLDLRFSDREMSALYDDYRGPAYTELRDSYEPGYREKNARLVAGAPYVAEVEAFLRPRLPAHPRVLDWGGDTGVNSPFVRERQCLDIFDISKAPVVSGARQVDHAMIVASHYDLVVCSNVLEHVPYPYDVLLDLRQVMTPTTLLYLEVPCEELMLGAEARDDVHLRKKHWHEHVNFFSHRSLAALARRAGLRLLDSRQAVVPSETSSNTVLMVACRLQDD